MTGKECFLANQEGFENLTLDEAAAEELFNIPVEEDMVSDLIEENKEDGALYDAALFAADDGAEEEDVDFD